MAKSKGHAPVTRYKCWLCPFNRANKYGISGHFNTTNAHPGETYRVDKVQEYVEAAKESVKPKRKRMKSLSVESSNSLEDDDGPDATKDQSLGEPDSQATDMLKTPESAEETIKDLQHDIDRRETERQVTAQALKDQNMIIEIQKAEVDIRTARQRELLLTNEGYRKDIAWLKWNVRARDNTIAELRKKLGDNV